jgi:hypothetical protein
MKTVLPSEVSSLPHGKAMGVLIGIGAVLASEIAAVLSLAFLASQGLFSLTLTSGEGSYLVAAPLSGLLAGLLTWWLSMVRPKRATVRRGVLLGAMSSVIAHPLMWKGVALLSTLTGTNLFGRLLGPSMFLDLPLVLSLSLMSLFYVGWITTLVGGATGGVLMYLQRTLMLRSWQQGDPRGKDGTGVAAPGEA